MTVHRLTPIHAGILMVSGATSREKADQMPDDDHDWITDYDRAIDHLFEGLEGATWLVMTGWPDGFGIALSDRTKERLVERHGMAAARIVYNTGYYPIDPLRSIKLTPPSKPTLIERIRRVFRGRKAALPSDEDMPYWARLLREKEQETALLKERRDRVPDRHGPHQRLH